MWPACCCLLGWQVAPLGLAPGCKETARTVMVTATGLAVEVIELVAKGKGKRPCVAPWMPTLEWRFSNPVLPFPT